MLLKQKSPSLSRNLALGTFDQLLIVFSTNVNLLYLLYSTDQRCCLLHAIKQNYLQAKLFAKHFPKDSNLDDSGIFLPVFPSRTNLNLHNISITPKMVKKVLKKLDSPKASRFDCIPVVVLKKVSERALFSRLLEGLISGPCIFKNVEEMSTARNYLLVSLLSVVTKVLEKLVNSRIVDHLEKCGIFSGFQYGFRSSR